jgi:hypothetical protein
MNKIYQKNCRSQNKSFFCDVEAERNVDLEGIGVGHSVGEAAARNLLDLTDFDVVFRNLKIKILSSSSNGNSIKDLEWSVRWM